jgi:signal transduction histidine kinase
MVGGRTVAAVYRLIDWLRGHPLALDVALVAGLILAPSTWLLPAGRPMWVKIVVYGAMVLPILSRRRYPVGAAVVVHVAAWVQYFGLVWADALPIGHVAIDVMVYNLVVRGRRGSALAATASGLAFHLLAVFTREIHPRAFGSVLACIGLVVIPWLCGEFVRARRAYLAEVERRAELVESERRALARAAVAEERNRIARELHDVLAHSLSVMVVNAEGATLMRHSDPQVVDRTLKTVSATGRSALIELRRMLDVLPADPGNRAPQPTTAQLRDLVDRSATGRAPIGLTVTGEASSLPPSVALQTYRIVQEALTNVVKHSPPETPAQVTVDAGADGPARRVQIEVVNAAGGTGTTVALPRSGHGLAGLRERVALFDGSLDAGPTADGGFRVFAVLPVRTDEELAV